MVPLGFCTSCITQNPRVELPEETPPIIARQRALSEDASDPLLRSALDEYKDNLAIRELVDAVRRYSTAPLTAGNHVSVLIDGPETFAAMESELRAARHHIHIQTFIFGAGDVGRRFSELLAQKRTEGVKVRVLYDSVGSMETPAGFFDELRRQGIEVREFRPMNPVKTPRIWNIHNRDHRKIIVVDGDVGFTSATSRPRSRSSWNDGRSVPSGSVSRSLASSFSPIGFERDT